MNDLVVKSNSFLHFSQEHSKCSKIGLRPNLIDDVDEIIEIAKVHRLNNLVMNHVEISGDAENQYIIMLRMESNGEYACLIDFSRDMTSYLLGSNIYRLAPAYKHSLDKYRTQMVKSFETKDELNGECLSEGVLYTDGKYSEYDYDLKTEIDEPAVERCAQMCLNANIRSKYAEKINQLTSHNLSVENCQLYSYSLANQTCFIKFKAVREDFKRLQSYYQFDSLLVTGKPTCQSKFSGSKPVILMKKIRTVPNNFLLQNPGENHQSGIISKS